LGFLPRFFFWIEIVDAFVGCSRVESTELKDNSVDDVFNKTFSGA
jgi:hypothetical protein